MKFISLIMMLFVPVILYSQRHVVLDSNYIKTVEYYDKSNTRVKKEYYYDAEGLLHPKVLRYNRKGVLEICYHYNHGKYLKSDYYSTKKGHLGEVIKINGLKIDRSHSKYMYSVDSSTVHTSTINYTDENGLRQGKWYIRNILTDDVFGFSHSEYYYTGIYEDGMKQGKWKYYHYYGKQLKGLVSYENDTIHGEVSLYNRKGNKVIHYEYEKGSKNGVYEVYYDTGLLRVKGMLKDNEFIGEYTKYKENGKIEKYIPDTTVEHPFK